MTPEKQKVIDRVLKLFKLGSKDANTTEHELLLAVTKARQMMADHQITMADIELAKGKDKASRIEVIINERAAYTRAGGHLAKYDHAVASAVAVMTDTQSILVTTRDMWGRAEHISMSFIGEEGDTVLATALFPIWLGTVRRMAYSVYGSGKNSWTARHTAYAVGVGVRMYERAKEATRSLSPENQQTWGLVLASKSEAVERYKAQRGVLPTKQRKAKPLDAEAYLKGILDGDGVDMSTKVFK